MILRATVLLLCCSILVASQGDGSSSQSKQASTSNGVPGAPNTKAALVAQKAAAGAVAKADVAVKQVIPHFLIFARFFDVFSHRKIKEDMHGLDLLASLHGLRVYHHCIN
jgi:hypothetical protein